MVIGFGSKMVFNNTCVCVYIVSIENFLRLIFLILVFGIPEAFELFPFSALTHGF